MSHSAQNGNCSVTLIKRRTMQYGHVASYETEKRVNVAFILYHIKVSKITH
jgi:hypothetical protein